MFLVILCIHLDIAEHIIVFLFLDWRIAVILWILTFFINSYLFRKRLACSRKARELYEKIITKHEQKRQTKMVYSDGKFVSSDYMEEKQVEEWRSISSEDVRNKAYGPIIVTPYVRYDWIWVHFAGPGVFTLAALLHGVIGMEQIYYSALSTIGKIAYDAVWWYGVATIGYWIGYWVERITPAGQRKGNSFSGWRNWYHFVYVVFFIVWWIFFVFFQFWKVGR